MKKRAYKICGGAALYVLAVVIDKVVFESKEIAAFDENWWIRFILFAVPFLIVGAKVLKKAFRNIIRGKIFDENFLMAIASVGAFCIGQYAEAIAVMLFYQIGELFEDYAVGNSRKSIASLMNIRPDYANVKRDNTVEKVDPHTVKIGDIILIRPGEKVPLDGQIKWGKSTLNMAALTGESIPQVVEEGSAVLSGSVNLYGLIEVEVQKEFGQSTVSKILELVQDAAGQKSKTENFITRFAAYYTPAVVGAAVLLVIIPVVFIPGASFSQWLYRALNFLVVSCPCALVISVPLSFFGGIGGASKQGILVKGSNYLEAVSHTEIVVMDKTGTLTKGTFDVVSIEAEKEYSQEDILEFAAYAESNSSHPISKSIVNKYLETGKQINEEFIGELEETAGLGVKALVKGRNVLAGNMKLLKKYIDTDFANSKSYDATTVYVAVDGKYAGCILVADGIKEDSLKAIQGLKSRGIKTVMLTGDNEEVAQKIGDSLGVEKVFAKLMPQDKVSKVAELINNKSEKGKLVFVGDGINDAPVIARADVGIAMGGLGSDAAIEAADIVVMNDEPSKLLNLIDISKKTLTIVKQNIVFALGVKLVVLVLSALGLANMWAAVFADVGVSMLAILNSLRAMRAMDEKEN